MTDTTGGTENRNLGFDTSRRFIRIIGERPNGLVEFAFAIGEPEIFVEMILTKDALLDFIGRTRAEMLPSEPKPAT